MLPPRPFSSSLSTSSSHVFTRCRSSTRSRRTTASPSSARASPTTSRALCASRRGTRRTRRRRRRSGLPRRPSPPPQGARSGAGSSLPTRRRARGRWRRTGRGSRRGCGRRRTTLTRLCVPLLLSLSSPARRAISQLTSSFAHGPARRLSAKRSSTRRSRPRSISCTSSRACASRAPSARPRPSSSCARCARSCARTRRSSRYVGFLLSLCLSLSPL